MVKLWKAKERKSGKQQERNRSLPEDLVHLMIDFSSERTESRKQLKDTLKVLTEKNIYTKNYISAKLTFRNEEEIKSSTDLKKKIKILGEHIGSRPAFGEYNRKSFGLKGSDTRRELKFTERNGMH